MDSQHRSVNPDKRIVDLLTERQQRLVKMTFTGATNQQIAYLTGRSLKTVKNHFTQIYKATGAKNRPHMAVLLWLEIEGKARNGT